MILYPTLLKSFLVIKKIYCIKIVYIHGLKIQVELRFIMKCSILLPYRSHLQILVFWKLLKLFLLLITSTFLNNMILLFPNCLELQTLCIFLWPMDSEDLALWYHLPHNSQPVLHPSLSSVIGYCFWFNQEPVFTLLWIRKYFSQLRNIVIYEYIFSEFNSCLYLSISQFSMFIVVFHT